ncbi:DUF6152 family protein [Altericroceibacterium xinjiangense]|uniref:DUF6152 family protein n=1 Tax=Altericroceibacterium xinjiangense TaxID=762261 RepID=UPI000F7F42B1|nr:DUF6152 family protein [Altericroceibacterium xinjiangense]
MKPARRSRLGVRPSIHLALLPALLLAPAAAQAHHSFAVFFDPSKTVTVTGKVTEFRFTNPHGTLALEVPGKDGTIQRWRVETNAPVVLARRGWSRGALKPGDTVTVEGWPARDGKPYLRLRRATDAQGQPIGQPFGQGDG